MPQALAKLDISQAADMFRRLEFKLGQTPDRHGLYLLNTTSGVLEGWTLNVEELPHYSISDDNRWITATVQNTHYLVDRRTGDAVSWVAGKATLLAAAADRVIFAGPDQFILTKDGLRKAVSLEGLQPPEVHFSYLEALFSLDGRYLVLINRLSVHLVDVGTGEFRTLPGITPDGKGRSIYQIRPGRTGLDDAFTLAVSSDGADRTSNTVVYRYSWAGERIGEAKLPNMGALSPDGSLVAWQQSLEGLTHAVVIGDAQTGEPLFRVRGAGLCDSDLFMLPQPWLSDSSGLVVQVQTDRRILTRDGRLRELPTVVSSSGMHEFQPAPNRPDLFAVGRSMVVDITGRVVAEAPLNRDFTPGHLAPWGALSDELRFDLPHLGHGGRCAYPYTFDETPVLEKPPFRQEVLLQPDLPAGDCANLREQPALSATVITCLRGGSLLTVDRYEGPWPPGVMYPTSTNAHNDGEWWVFVRNAAGQKGWVAVRAGNLKWVP